MLRTLIFAVICLLPLGAAASEAPSPLFSHTDSGPIRVMDGDTGEVLPIQSARAEIRAFVERSSALLTEPDAGTAAALESAIDEGRRLEETLETQLVGTLYLEEALRRLKRARLALVPVDESEIVRTARTDAPDRLGKPLFVRRGVDDLETTYATFAACLELADFPSEPGPRTVHMEPDGALWTRVNGQPLAFDIIAYAGDRMLLRSVIIGASRSLGLKDKLHVARLVLDNCV